MERPFLYWENRSYAKRVLVDENSQGETFECWYFVKQPRLPGREVSCDN